MAVAGAVAGMAFRGLLAVDLPGGPMAGTTLDLAGRSDFSFDRGRIGSIVDHSD